MVTRLVKKVLFFPIRVLSRTYRVITAATSVPDALPVGGLSGERASGLLFALRQVIERDQVTCKSLQDSCTLNSMPMLVTIPSQLSPAVLSRLFLSKSPSLLIAGCMCCRAMADLPAARPDRIRQVCHHHTQNLSTVFVLMLLTHQVLGLSKWSIADV